MVKLEPVYFGEQFIQSKAVDIVFKFQLNFEQFCKKRKSKNFKTLFKVSYSLNLEYFISRHFAFFQCFIKQNLGFFLNFDFWHSEELKG